MRIEGKWILAAVVLVIALGVGGGTWQRLAETKGGSRSVKDEDVTTASQSTGLKAEDIVTGTGQEAVTGSTLTVNYKGTLLNGTQFDSSYDRGQPFTFVVGAGQVIAGWDQGLVGMKVGGKRRLTIPPELGYGSQAAGTIPANSTLVFEVELLKVTPTP